MTERAEARCTAELNGTHCDREPGHAGSHRGYLEQVDEAVFWGNGGADRIEAIKARLAAASRGPWQACRMTHIDRPGQDMTPEEIGEYVTNAVRQSGEDSGSMGFLFVSVNTDSGPKDVCHVGNGPTSPANADFIQHAKDDIEFLLTEIARSGR